MTEPVIEQYEVPGLEVSNLEELLGLCGLAGFDHRLVEQFPYSDGCVFQAGRILVWRPGKGGKGTDMIVLADRFGLLMCDLLDLAVLANFHHSITERGGPVIALGSQLTNRGFSATLFGRSSRQIGLRKAGDCWDDCCRYVVKYKSAKSGASQP